MDFVKENGIRQSMDGKSRWADNIMIERWFRSFKYEEAYLTQYNNIKDDKHFIVYPQMVWSESRRAVPTGKKVSEGFSYSSGNNTQWLTVEEIKELLNTIELEK